MFGDGADKVVFGSGTNYSFDFFVIFEDDVGGDGHDTVLGGNVGMFIDVYFFDSNFSSELFLDLLYYGFHKLTRCAPRGPMI